MDLNFVGRSDARWGMWRSPRARTNTILPRLLPDQASKIFTFISGIKMTNKKANDCR